MTAVGVVPGPVTGVTGVTAVTGHYFLVRLGKKKRISSAVHVYIL